MEHNYRVSLGKFHKAYGKFAGSAKQPLFIVVHGLPCSMMEGLYERACWWFAQHGYATYRFNLYGWQKDARQLIDCTLETHAKDLDAVVVHFRRKGFKKIFVVGHSFGGTAVLMSKKQQFDTAVLWDPSYGLSVTKKTYGSPAGKGLKEVDGYLMHWGVSAVIGKKMAKELDVLDWDRLSESFHVPLKIIAARNGVLVPGCKKYFAHANSPKNLEILAGATHYFDDSPAMQHRLFAATHTWFKI